MHKLRIDHERPSSDKVTYDELEQIIERFNDLIDVVESLQRHLSQISPE